MIDNILIQSFVSIWNNEHNWKEFRSDRVPVCSLRQQFTTSGVARRSVEDDVIS